jgi:hypothetical protein
LDGPKQIQYIRKRFGWLSLLSNAREGRRVEAEDTAPGRKKAKK